MDGARAAADTKVAPGTAKEPQNTSLRMVASQPADAAKLASQTREQATRLTLLLDSVLQIQKQIAAELQRDDFDLATGPETSGLQHPLFEALKLSYSMSAWLADAQNACEVEADECERLARGEPSQYKADRYAEMLLRITNRVERARA